LKCDVLVLGGGPAGCAAALVCAESGLDVVLLRQESPAVRVIESMTPGCEVILERMGLDVWLRENARPYPGVWRGGSLDRFTSSHGFHVERSLLDQALVQAIASAGVKVFDNEVAKAPAGTRHGLKGVVTGSGQYEATWTIDATGRRAFLSKALKLRPQFWSEPLVAWRGEMEHQENRHDESPEFLSDEDGWWWLVPQGGNRIAWTRLSSTPCKPALPPTLAGIRELQPAKATNVRWRISRPTVGMGWILAGDAAASLDPGTGQGIYFALRGGIAAAHAVIDCVLNRAHGEASLAAYDQWQHATARNAALQLSALYRGMGLHWAARIRIP
jgi:flavin-dependent dehydrogenase